MSGGAGGGGSEGGVSEGRVKIDIENLRHTYMYGIKSLFSPKRPFPPPVRQLQLLITSDDGRSIYVNESERHNYDIS